MSVKIYSTPGCPYCKQAKTFFEKNKVEFEDIDVSKDDLALEEMKRKSGSMSVPVIDVDEKILVGFDEGEIKKALKINKTSIDTENEKVAI